MRWYFDTFVPYKSVSSESQSLLHKSKLVLAVSSPGAVAALSQKFLVSGSSSIYQGPCPPPFPDSTSCWPLSPFPNLMKGLWVYCPCSCLVESLWTSSVFWVRASNPFHFQTSDFSKDLSILRPTSLVKSPCKHKPQTDLFKSLCNSCFPSACQTTRKDSLCFWFPFHFPLPPKSLPCCHKPTQICTDPSHLLYIPT